MNTNDENLLLKVVKKVVGLPTESSGCSCGAPVVKANDCCSAETPEKATSECGCGSVPAHDAEQTATARA